MRQQAVSMEGRLEQLERRCRKLTVGLVALATILATACLSSAMREDPEVLRAKRFEAVDDQGRTAAVLAGSFRDGVPGAGLRVGDLEGDAYAMLGVHPAVDEESEETYHGVVLLMRAQHAGESGKFLAGVLPDSVLNEVANKRRAIVSYVEPEESSFKVESRCKPGCALDCNHDCGRTLLEVLAEGEELSVLSLDENAEVRFELP